MWLCWIGFWPLYEEKKKKKSETQSFKFLFGDLHKQVKFAH